MIPHTIPEVLDEFEAYEELSEDPKAERNRLLLTLARHLEPMPEALKTDTTLVTGCNAKVWVYPVPTSNANRLHFLADSDSAITKGIIAVILMAVQDKSAHEVLETNIEAVLEPLDLAKHMTSRRTSGLKNMILKVRATAARLAS
jgi:cysteine desulfuration protein SufE